MASSDQLVMSEVKIEIDIAEEPARPWRSQHHCSGTTSDWSENGVTSTITPCEKSYWNSSTATMKCEPGIQPASGQGIKAEPVDHSVTGDMFHQFQSADNKEEKVDIKCESCTCDDFSSLPLDPRSVVKSECKSCTCADLSSSLLDPWSVVKSEDSKPKFWTNRSEVNIDWQTESTGVNVISDEAVRANIISTIVKTERVTADISDNVIKTEPVNTNIGEDIKTELLIANTSNIIKTETATTNISSDVQTEAVTDIMMTVTCDAVRSEAISSRDEEKNRPAGDKQKKRTPQPSGTNKTSLHKSANTSGSLLSLNKSHVCQCCSAAFVLFSFLKQHMASVHGEKLQVVFPESSTPESCDVGHCGNMDIEKKVGNLGDRKTVERKKNQTDNKETDGTDLEKDSRRHVCDVCTKGFSRAGDLNRHKLIHTGHKPFVCDVCIKAFTRASDLKTHKLFHTGHKQFVCDVCSKAFTRASILKTHKLMIHTGHKQFVCDMCSKAFTRACDLKTHKLIHTGHKQFVCDVCSKAFTRASDLKTHKLIHTGHKQFVCDVCSKAFTRASHLKTHKLIHTGHKQFVCDVCSKAFTQASDLKTHKRTHTGEKPFVCTDCGDSFAQSQVLKNHCLTHTGEKPHTCPHCPAAFSRPCSLKKHVQKLHQ